MIIFLMIERMMKKKSNDCLAPDGFQVGRFYLDVAYFQTLLLNESVDGFFEMLRFYLFGKGYQLSTDFFSKLGAVGFFTASLQQRLQPER